ncbi:MAG: hypothetical protein IKO20_01520 [Bacteroidaceae bacterium]|nr:hypothetical protein [Bacteroidaceae bacterium]
MKKELLLIALIAVAAVCTSCGGGMSEADQVKEFATGFATKVSQNQVDSIRALYADAAKIDSFAVAFVPDSVSVAETETPGTYKVSLGTADFTVKRADDGTMSVTGSHGLAAYPADALDFAKKTGQWKDGLSDAEQAVRMADKDFRPYVEASFPKAFAKMLMVKGKLRIVKGLNGPAVMAVGTMGANVVSTCDKPIDGKDYEVVFKGQYIDFAITPTTVREPGKNIAPKGSVLITTEFMERLDLQSAYVNIKISNDALFNKYFTPTGNEYDEYLKSKQVTSDNLLTD